MLLHENGNEKRWLSAAHRRSTWTATTCSARRPGHLNITGMSGLSTKTSHALFTIASTFQTVKDKKVAALMFNVKGADLLYLDKPVEVDPAEDPELAGRYEKAGQRGLPPEDREMYESLGLEVRPFENLKIFAPLALRHGRRERHRPRRRHLGAKAEHAERTRAGRTPASTRCRGTSRTCCRTRGASSTRRT